MREAGRSKGACGSAVLTPTLERAVRDWADACTGDRVARRGGALRDKEKAVTDFFIFAGKTPAKVAASDVRRWRNRLEEAGLAPNTVYALVSRVSSFFDWAMRFRRLLLGVKRNPAAEARPGRPGAGHSMRAKAYTGDEISRLLAALERHASEGSVVAKRDRALLLIYLMTGKRRGEVITLRGHDVEFSGSGLVVGGVQARAELCDEAAGALLDYLRASGRDSIVGTDAPLWTRHDRAGKPGAQLTSHAFTHNLKLYAKEAGVSDARLQRVRSTFERIAAGGRS